MTKKMVMTIRSMVMKNKISLKSSMALAMLIFATGSCAQNSVIENMNHSNLAGCWTPASESGAYSEIGKLLIEENKIYWIKTEYKDFRPVKENCEAGYSLLRKIEKSGTKSESNDSEGAFTEFEIQIDIPEKCYIGNLERAMAFRIKQERGPNASESFAYAEVVMYRSREEMDKGRVIAQGGYFRGDIKECESIRSK